MTTYLVTGASGQLGRLVIEDLVTRVPAGDVVALVRRQEAADELAKLGVQTRLADYTDADALAAAMKGVDRVLLISSSEVGQRAAQHQAVIDAAKGAGVSFIAYTSILGASASPMILAQEHRATEEALAASGLPHALLRNGWYSENLLASLETDLSIGQHFGAAGEGKFSAAPRRDFAAAAAAVLATDGHDGKTYELGGDTAFTLAEFTKVLSDASGKEVAYVDMPQEAYAEALTGAGVPGPFAGVLADSDAGAAAGWLHTDSGDLGRLIGRPTEPIATTVKAAVA